MNGSLDRRLHPELILRIFGVARLASRICDIEKQTGITPNRKRIQVTNRHGKEVWVNEYWIEKEDAQ